MERDIRCEACGRAMHKIGPFARRKAEGESARKYDGTDDYECVSEECPNKEKIIKVGPLTEEEYLEDARKVCGACGHSRLLHKSGFSLVPDGQPIPVFNSDAPCRADRCECQKFSRA